MSSFARGTNVHSNPYSTVGFRGGRAPGPNDVFIAVMGVTGSGKSSFISLCARKRVEIGHTLGACTSVVDVYAYELSPDRTVYLIDTPGFDDTNRSDAQVLREIATWLGDSYQNKILLSGILYLHRISDIRMQGSAKRNLTMFTELCGDDALKKVILVTTMWDKVASEDASMREKELFDKPEFWGYMLSKGSTSHRHSNTEESARAIVDLLAKNNRPITTNLQKELVDEHRSLNQTSAGRELESELNKEKAKWDIERREIEEQMKVAIKQQNREAEQAMREERERYTSMIKKAEEDTGVLRSDMEKLLAHRDERVTRLEQQLKEQQAAYDAAFKLMKSREKRLEKEKAKLAKKTAEPKKSPSPSPSPTDREKSKGREKSDSEEEVAVATWTRTNEKDVESHSRKTVYVPFCVVLHGTKFAGFSSEYNASQMAYPEMRKGSGVLAATSYGESHEGALTWIARYNDGTWATSEGLFERYGNLGTILETRGFQDLETCVLGPGNTYYARWRTNKWSCHGKTELRKAVRMHNTMEDGSTILNLTLGFGGSYVISYGRRNDLRNVKSVWDLRGHYEHLSKFLDKNKDISIVALSLDPLSKITYMMIFREPDKAGRWQIRWFGVRKLEKPIRDWWHKS